jgi:hypothetical protein
MDSPRHAPDGLLQGVPDGLRALMEEFEGQVAQGMERLVAGEGFSELLVAMTENTVAVWKISADVWDLVWRGLRLPARADFDRLARQLARTEDKLELLLQAVEQLQDREVKAPSSERAPAWSSGPGPGWSRLPDRSSDRG